MLFKVLAFCLVATVCVTCAAHGGEDRQGRRVKLAFGNEEAFVSMFATPSARDFVALLPLTLAIQDYNATENCRSA